MAHGPEGRGAAAQGSAAQGAAPQGPAAQQSERPQFHVDKELDLRGEVCPYTFVKSKLALEPMRSGEVLRVLVDYEPAKTSVPQSMRSEGHQVLYVGEVPGERLWEIVVKRA